MQFYKDTPLTLADMTAPEFGGVDVLERVIPVAKKHGIRVFPFILEDNQLPAAVKTDWEKLYEVDHHGRRTTGHPGGPCFNNPGYRISHWASSRITRVRTTSAALCGARNARADYLTR